MRVLNKSEFFDKYNHSRQYYLKMASSGRCDADKRGGEDDYHVWVIDKHGEVIFDPYFKEYDMTRDIRCCGGMTHYKEWSQEYQGEFWKRTQIKIKKTMADCRKQGGTNKGFWRMAEEPSYGRCPINSASFMRRNKGKDYRIVIGSMGWSKDDKTGIFWEYGNGEDSP
jgi:hypothetical protein